LQLPLLCFSFCHSLRESASSFVVAVAFLAVIPQGSASSVSLAVAFVFLAVIPSAARNLLLARSARSSLPTVSKWVHYGL
jgi:hypothetical protein